MQIEGDAVPYFGNTTIDDPPLTSETRSSALTAPILRNSQISHLKRQVAIDQAAVVSDPVTDATKNSRSKNEPNKCDKSEILTGRSSTVTDRDSLEDRVRKMLKEREKKKKKSTAPRSKVVPTIDTAKIIAKQLE